MPHSPINPHLLYYISGHGFGHAQRSAEVIRALLSRRPDVQVHIRTAAPRAIFADLGPRAHYEQVVIDRGCIEIDALTLDWPTTLRHVRSLLDERPALVEREAAFVRARGIRLIAADIPFLAGEVAHATGIPCWAVGNFTWDWIYEPVADPAAHGDLVAQIRRGYERMDGLLSIPFRHEMTQFRQVIDVPLIAARPRLARDQALLRLGLSDTDRRPRVLAAMRGGIPLATLEHAARQCPEALFLLWAHPGDTRAANVISIPPGAGLTFHDVLQTVDAVVTKVGHGIITDCIAMGVAILWPPRSGFREDAMLMRLAGPYLRHRPIGLEAYRGGEWAADLRALLACARPAATLPANGAQVVADVLLARLEAPAAGTAR
jgi:hypothetical protein